MVVFCANFSVVFCCTTTGICSRINLEKESVIKCGKNPNESLWTRNTDDCLPFISRNDTKTGEPLTAKLMKWKLKKIKDRSGISSNFPHKKMFPTFSDLFQYLQRIPTNRGQYRPKADWFSMILSHNLDIINYHQPRYWSQIATNLCNIVCSL